MTTLTHSAPNAETVAAARLLLTQMGISPADLVTTGEAVPTFGEVIPKVWARLSAGTLRTYNTHLDHLLTAWADHRLDQPNKTDLEAMARTIQANARTNRASRGGTSAAEHFISATRCVYRYAEDNGWIRPRDNPARQLTMPARRPSHRYAIPSGPTRRDLPHHSHHRRRPRTRHPHPAPAHRNRLPPRRRPRPAPTRPRPRPMPDLPAREGRHRPLATRLPYPDAAPARSRDRTPKPPIRAAAALPQRKTHHGTAFRLHLEPHRRDPALGRHPGHHDALATPHHPHLGRTNLQLRRRPRIRRTPRKSPRHHRHLRQIPPPRSRRSTIRAHRRTPPTRARTPVEHALVVRTLTTSP